MEIECKFRNSSCEYGYECFVDSASITKPNTKVAAFVGLRLPGKSDEDVKAIKFYDTEVKYFPRGIGQLFPNLKSLTISYCGLKEVTKQDLAGLQNLIELELKHNELVSLPPDLLDDMKNMRNISFYGNNLEFIDSRMFEPLKNQLSLLYLGENKNIDVFYQARNGPFTVIYAGSLKTIDDVMKAIDEKCSKPKVERNEAAGNGQKGFNLLWDPRRFSDFTINVDKIMDKKEIKVHKAVLGTQSSIFAAMFENEMEEKRLSQMTVNEFSSSSVEDFVKYFYTGEIPDETNAMEVFALAVKYDVEDLTFEMEEIISRNIDHNNALDVLEFGNLFNSELIMLAAFKEVKSANPEVNLVDGMKFKPGDIKKLIEARRQCEQDIEELRKKLMEMETRLNCN